MTQLPAGIKYEFEQVVGSGTWTDITSFVYASQPTSIKFGRQSQYTVPSAATMSLVLLNDTGTWTPNRQVLTDGVTPNPYYPNVSPGRRIRMSYTISGTTYYRFSGPIQALNPQIDDDGTNPVMVVLAIDGLQHLSRVSLVSPLLQVAKDSAPITLFPLTEPQGSLSAIDYFGGSGSLRGSSVGVGTGTITFGQAGPGNGDGTGVQLTATTVSNGRYLVTSTLPASIGSSTATTLQAWVQRPTNPSAVEAVCSLEAVHGNLLITNGPNYGRVLQLTTSGFAQFTDEAGDTITGSASICDGGWHLLTVTYSGGTSTLYVDGVSVGTVSTTGSGTPSTFRTLRVGQTALGSGLASACLSGFVGYVSIYTSALTALQVAAQSTAGDGYAGESTGARIQRWLTTAGLTSANWNLDPGVAIVGTYPQSGKTVFDACQDMVASEGGGAAFYQTPDGKIRFADRNYRRPAAPLLTVDAGADLDASALAPALDLTTLVNSSTANRASESGTQSSQTWEDLGSIGQFDESDDTVTTYTQDDDDALHLAQYHVATQSTPGLRLPQITIDLLTATSSGLYAAVAGVQIGDRIRVVNLDSGVSPVSQLDVLAEGWTETVGIDQYKIVYDGSPADNPPFMIWGGTGAYSRWQCSGQTLTSTITAAATALSITTSGAGNPTFTTASTAYPMNIKIGQEVITLQTAPGGSTSPQSFTGVLRGQQGTPASAQTASSLITLYPALRWAL